jgi:hypothetical protein
LFLCFAFDRHVRCADVLLLLGIFPRLDVHLGKLL